jgi:hypothetical protein
VLIRAFFLGLVPTCQMVMHCCYLSRIDYYMNQEAMQVIVYKILKYCMYLGDHFIPIYVLLVWTCEE